MHDLATDLAIFMWDYDTYGCMDYYHTITECISETVKQLYDKVCRSGIADYLKKIIEDEEDDQDATKAAELYRKIMEV